MSKFKAIIDRLFDSNKSFKKEDFLEFISDLTGKYPNNIIIHPASVDSEGNKYYRENICVYEDISGEKIAILIYKMPSASKVEKARSHQRNLISTYLKNEGVYDDIDNVLVAFYCENNPDWRLSFIKQEFKLSDTEFDSKGRKKIVNELTPAKRFSFLVDSNSKNITVKQRLNSLLEKSDISISDVENAFSVEKVSKDFFDKYVKLYEKLTNAFKEDKVFLKIESESNHGDEHFRDNFVKKLLGQIVFLYFLQKKGWLGVEKGAKWGTGKKDFLQSLLKECLSGGDENKELGGKNFFNDYLEHLFYDNLNKKREDDFSEYFNCKIPYLNGGLFEPINNYHWKGLNYVVLAGEKNNLLFKEIFDTFDEYNFTVYENDPLEQDVAVDPEMLGKVFENLLPENERKGKGAFYTPREIVHYMCKESLKNHIINKTGISEDKINGLFEKKDSMYNSRKFKKDLPEEERYKQFGEYIDYAENIVNALKSVKIVDPAVGSGAFPMGLLKEIVSLRKYLQENILLEDNVSEYQIKKETLENCIYGVDLDPGAVEIAKLRFWLSLVIEEESGDKIDPLPNLDYKIMQGNSLIEDVVVGDTVIKLDLENNTKKLTKKEEKEFNKTTQGTMALFADEEIRDDILKRLKFLHKVFFQEKDNNKKKDLKKEIDHIEKELIRISGEVEVNKLQTQIENIEGKYILSGMAWDEKDAKKVAAWQATIASIKEMEEKYKRDNIRSFFPWKLHFGEVFNDNGGFDIVIGNPPYVGQKGNKEIFELIRKGNLKEFYQGKIDLLYLFFHLGLNIGKNKSQIGFITTNYFITANGANKLRNDFKSRAIIRKLINLNELKIFETAKGQHNIITIIQKGQNNDFISKNCITSRKGYYLDLKGGKILEDILNGSDSETEYFSVKQTDLYDGNENYIRLGGINGKSKTDKILNKIKSLGKELGNILNVNQGLRTGVDKVSPSHIAKTGINDVKIGDGIFILNNKEYFNLNLSTLENSKIKPLFKNSDISKYYTNKSSQYKLIDIFFPNDKNIKLDNYPIIFNHLKKFKKILENRKENANGINKQIEKGIYWFASVRRKINFDGEKIVCPQRSKRNIFAYNDIPWYASADVYFITLKNNESHFDLKYILSILNSKIVYFWLYHRGKRKGEYLELYGTPLKEIPIKKISPEEQKPFVDLVDQILEITKNEDYLEREDLQNQVKVLEKKIDDMVYELYGLTKEEIELVEESLGVV